MKLRRAICRVLTLPLASLLVAVSSSSAQVIATGGPVPHNQVRERELLQQVKAPVGFSVTLFAAPPVAMYPTCLTSGIEGVVFVCVDPNLSLSATKGTGRIVRLVDANGDGAADSYTVFAKMDSPRGVAFDGRTLYVMHPPTLTAYRDTDGDGVSDVSEDLVTGLGFDLDFRGADHTTNGITLGIDGWLYIAVGDYGYRHAVGRDGTVISRRGGGVVRVRRDGSGLELYALGTRNIYDVAVDPFLHVFTRDNTNDGDGWNTRLHYLPAGANMGYPMLYKHFASEHMPSLADYGSGSGTGGLWVHDAGFPAGFGNTLYTADWLTNQVLRHTLTPKGGSYAVGQEAFLSVPHPSDMAMDGHSNMFVASLSGGSFTYEGDSVGYIVRLRPLGGPVTTTPDIASLNGRALARLLSTPNAEHRLRAQHELLRRDDRSGATRTLTAIILDRRQPGYGRVAAMYTLLQLAGEASRGTLRQAASDPTLRAFALRALADDPTAVVPVDRALFVRSLSDSNAEVQLAALAAIVRVGAADAAEAIIPLTASSDAAVSHVAVNALASLHASRAALAALHFPNAAIRLGALRALQLLHDPDVVTALIAQAGQSAGAAAQRDVIVALARLFHREAEWNGEWWGTRPSFLGPYFAPTPWESSPLIAPVLRGALVDASLADRPGMVDDFIRNRVVPLGARSILAAFGDEPTERANVIATLVGHAQVDSSMLPMLTRLSGVSASRRRDLAQLLAGEPELTAGMLPLARGAVLDTALDEEVRAHLLSMVGVMPTSAGGRVATELFASVTPPDAAGAEAGEAPGPMEAAWRRYVGDRRRAQELSYFITRTRAASANERTFGFAVLLQAVRSNRGAAPVNDVVQPVLAEAWASGATSPDLVRAISIMGLQSTYADRLRAHRTSQSTSRAPRLDWTPLFNGKDLKGWDIKFAGHPLGENFRNTFRVEDGLLKVRYDDWPDFADEFGHLFYKQPFSYYIVAAEYRFVGRQVTGAGDDLSWAVRNNGIMVHSQSAASMGLTQDFPISLEVQLLGGTGAGTRTNGNLCTPGTYVVMNEKLVTAHCIDAHSITYDGDQWVRVEALVLGDSVIKHIVNGDTVLTYFKPQMGGGAANNTKPGVVREGQLLSSGYIALQAETAPIEFRKVEIVNLKGCMDPSAANFRSYFVKSDPASCRRR